MMKSNIRSSDSLRNLKNYSFSSADHLRSFLRVRQQRMFSCFVCFICCDSWLRDLHGVCQGIVEIFNIFIASFCEIFETIVAEAQEI
jgi:hypothetical protein